MLESTLFTKKSDNYDLNAHKFEIHNWKFPAQTQNFLLLVGVTCCTLLLLLLLSFYGSNQTRNTACATQINNLQQDSLPYFLSLGWTANRVLRCLSLEAIWTLLNVALCWKVSILYRILRCTRIIFLKIHALLRRHTYNAHGAVSLRIPLIVRYERKFRR